MELSALKAQIKSGELRDTYIFTGIELAVQDIYINQMAKKLNRTVTRYHSITDLLQKLKTSTLVKTAQICVLRDCKELILDDKLNALIFNSKRKNDDILIFIYVDIDKRTKFYKNHSEDIVEFNPLSTDVLVKYVKKDIDLDDKHARMLIEVCENDYSRILLEIDKMKQYYKAFENSPTPSTKDLCSYNYICEKFLRNGCIYVPPYDAVFDFVNAVLIDSPEEAFRLLQESYDSGEATLVLISNLYNSAKQLLQVQSYTGNDLMKATGLTGFQIKLAKQRLNHYTDEELEYLMELTRNAETDIKMGKVEDRIAVEYVLSRFWNV